MDPLEKTDDGIMSDERHSTGELWSKVSSIEGDINQLRNDFRESTDKVTSAISELTKVTTQYATQTQGLERRVDNLTEKDARPTNWIGLIAAFCSSIGLSLTIGHFGVQSMLAPLSIRQQDHITVARLEFDQLDKSIHKTNEDSKDRQAEVRNELKKFEDTIYRTLENRDKIDEKQLNDLAEVLNTKIADLKETLDLPTLRDMRERIAWVTAKIETQGHKP